MSATTVTAYLRVSTDQQDQASQRQQIAAYALGAGLTINAEVADTASGSTPWQSRGIARLLAADQRGNTVVVSEVSRIARSVVGVLTALQQAAENGITVIAARNRLCLDQSLHAKITITVLALAAEIERDLIRDRTRAALQARKERGLPIGRQLGATGTSKCEPSRELIARLVEAKTPKRAIARLLKVSPQTLYDFLAQEQAHHGKS